MYIVSRFTYSVYQVYVLISAFRCVSVDIKRRRRSCQPMRNTNYKFNKAPPLFKLYQTAWIFIKLCNRRGLFFSPLPTSMPFGSTFRAEFYVQIFMINVCKISYERNRFHGVLHILVWWLKSFANFKTDLSDKRDENFLGLFPSTLYVMIE